MPPVTVAVRQLPHAEGLPLPAYATEHSAGMDLLAAVAEPVTLNPGERKLIPTGLTFALPDGYEVQVRPRSGLALKNGVTVLNSPGTVDADYRGEVGVILANLGPDPFTVERGMRIAQMVLARYERIGWQAVEALPESARGTGGFGSTGVQAGTKG